MSKKDHATTTPATGGDAAPDDSSVTVSRSLLRLIYTVLDGATAITDTAMGKRLAYIREQVDPVKRRVFELVVK